MPLSAARNKPAPPASAAKNRPKVRLATVRECRAGYICDADRNAFVCNEETRPKAPALVPSLVDRASSDLGVSAVDSCPGHSTLKWRVKVHRVWGVLSPRDPRHADCRTLELVLVFSL